MKLLFIILHIFVLSFSSFAQMSELKGIVTDNNQKPVAYATIMVLTAADSSMVKGGLTDTTGRFAVNSLTAGTYRLRITALGFATSTSQFITVSTTESVIDVGPIRLVAESTNL